MRDVNCYVKVAPTVHRKDEAEFLDHYDAPIAASNNETDKQLAWKTGAPAKSETYKPSSPSQVWRKKAITTRPLEEHDEDSIEKSIKPLGKPVEINIPSSPSHVWRKKVINAIPLEEPSQRFTEKSTGPSEELKEESIQENIRPSEEPSEESIEESTKSSEEFDEESIEKSIIALLEESDEESTEKSIDTLFEEFDEESIEKSYSTLFEESIEKSIIRLIEEFDTTDERCIEESAKPSQEPDEESVVESHVHYIRREGFGKANQEVAWMCGFCEKDLAIATFREEAEPQPFPKEELYWEFFLQQEEEQLENSLLPEVCIFPCGHAIHSLCLQIAQLEEHLGDAPCPICITLS